MNHEAFVNKNTSENLFVPGGGFDFPRGTNSPGNREINSEGGHGRYRKLELPIFSGENPDA